MRKIVAVCTALLIVACTSTGPIEQAGSDIPDTGRVMRFYSVQAPNLYLEWKYAAGRQGTAKVAEVAPDTQPDRTVIVSNPRKEAWSVGEILDVKRETGIVDRELMRGGKLRNKMTDAPVYVGSRRPARDLASARPF